jgi:hypothetical protein
MEESRVETRQTRLGVSGGRTTKGNIFAAFAQGGTDGEGEEEGSEYEQGKPGKGVKKTPGAPQARRAKDMPQTPTKEPTKSKASTTTKDATKENGNTTMKAFRAIMEELKASKAQQEANYTVLLDVVAALRSEIMALKLDNRSLREELGKSQSATKAKLEEIEAIVKNTNEKTKTGLATGMGTGSLAWINPRSRPNPTNN